VGVPKAEGEEEDEEEEEDAEAPPDASEREFEGADEGKAKKAMSKARQMELGEWERWALSRLKEGKLSKAEFTCEIIGDEEADLIRSAIKALNIPEEIKRVFAGRKGVPPPSKIKPPRPGEIAHRVGDLRAKLRAVLSEEAERSVKGP
jgi:hypothetical protein